jgi:hypothetical protein
MYHVLTRKKYGICSRDRVYIRLDIDNVHTKLASVKE